MRFFKPGLLLLLISSFAYAQKWEVGKTYTDQEKWTEFTVGNLPLIISVPHGGTITLADGATRDCKGAVTVTDSKTIELVKEIEKVFLEKYNARPFIILSNLSRKHLDQNRAIDEATCGNKALEKNWHQFHDYIDTAISIATQKFGKAIYIDLHGHGHTKQRLEVGYNLTANELRKTDAEKNHLAEKSSMVNLLATDKNLDLTQLLTGNDAFGTLIASAGFDAVPSKQDFAPLEEDQYFNGGYNTKRYTSIKYPKVFGWQIESNFKGVRDATGRPAFAKAFADVMAKYFKTHLKIAL